MLQNDFPCIIFAAFGNFLSKAQLGLWPGFAFQRKTLELWKKIGRQRNEDALLCCGEHQCGILENLWAASGQAPLQESPQSLGDLVFELGFLRKDGDK